MNRQEIEIIVKTSKNSSNFEAGEVTPSRRQLMWASLHHLREQVAFQSHSDGCHLSHHVAAVHHVLSPAFCIFSKVGEVGGNLVQRNFISDISNVPEVPPLGVEGRGRGSGGRVLLGEVLGDVLVFPGFFGVLGSGSDLEMMLREDISNRSTSIEIFGSPIEELLEHIQELSILLDLDSRVFDNEASIGMQSFRYFLTILHIVTRLGQKGLNINDRDREGTTKEPTYFEYFKHCF